MELSDLDVVWIKGEGIRLEDYRKLLDFAKEQRKTIGTHEACEREARKHISELNSEKDELYKIFDCHFGVTPNKFKNYEEFDKNIDGQLKEMWRKIEALNNCLKLVNKTTEDYLGICSTSYDSWDDYMKVVQTEIGKLKAKAEKGINDENRTSKYDEYESTGVFELPLEPIDVATELINARHIEKATKVTNALRKCFNLEETETLAVRNYTTDDLRQIAEHLLVYCNANKGE